MPLDHELLRLPATTLSGLLHRRQVSRQRMQTDELTLTPECRRWISGICARYAAVPIQGPTAEPPRREPFAFKFG